MATSDMKFKRTITERFAIKGILSEDCASIAYWDEDKNEQIISVADLLNAFKDQPIEMSVALKSEEDLDIIPCAEDDEQGGE